MVKFNILSVAIIYLFEFLFSELNASFYHNYPRYSFHLLAFLLNLGLIISGISQAHSVSSYNEDDFIFWVEKIRQKAIIFKSRSPPPTKVLTCKLFLFQWKICYTQL